MWKYKISVHSLLGCLINSLLLLSILISIFISVEEPEERKDVKDTPAQTKSRKMIADLKEQVSSLISLRNSGISTVTKKQIDNVKDAVKKEETRLAR